MTPKELNAKKHKMKPLMKNAKEPSRVLIPLIQGIFILCFPYLFPITDANVSDIIINKIAAVSYTHLTLPTILLV